MLTIFGNGHIGNDLSRTDVFKSFGGKNQKYATLIFALVVVQYSIEVGLSNFLSDKKLLITFNVIIFKRFMLSSLKNRFQHYNTKSLASV